ncbi:hypothetical protein, partial [Moorena bouillonii]|uniref:hypothetical protein n=1 Tax=Moorena bouillonii TaxID=207920 RepID=UPI001BE0E23E
ELGIKPCLRYKLPCPPARIRRTGILPVIIINLGRTGILPVIIINLGLRPPRSLCPIGWRVRGSH